MTSARLLISKLTEDWCFHSVVSEPLTEPVIPSRSSPHNSPVPVTELVAVVLLVASVWDSVLTPWLSLLFSRVVFWYCFISMLFWSCCWSDAMDFAPKVSFTSPWSDQLIVFEIVNSTVSVTVILIGSVPLT